jgi:hypothetical protein
MATLFFASAGVFMVSAAASTNNSFLELAGEKYVDRLRAATTLNIFVESDGGVLHCGE